MPSLRVLQALFPNTEHFKTTEWILLQFGRQVWGRVTEMKTVYVMPASCSRTSVGFWRENSDVRAKPFVTAEEMQFAEAKAVPTGNDDLYAAKDKKMKIKHPSQIAKIYKTPLA